MPRRTKIFLLCISEGVPKRSLLVAVVVGTVLNLINQGDALFGAGHVELLKAALTFAVPYCVATYGAVSYRLRLDAELSHRSKDPPRTAA
jgi:hypothetical protein